MVGDENLLRSTLSMVKSPNRECLLYLSHVTWTAVCYETFRKIKEIAAATYTCLLHVAREFHSIKLICRNLYAIFSHVKEAYTANQNGVQLFSHVDVEPMNDSVKAFASQSESCIVYIQIAFQILAAFYQRLLQVFLRTRRKALDLCQLAAQTCLYGLRKTRTHRANRREMSHY